MDKSKVFNIEKMQYFKLYGDNGVDLLIERCYEIDHVIVAYSEILNKAQSNGVGKLGIMFKKYYPVHCIDGNEIYRAYERRPLWVYLFRSNQGKWFARLPKQGQDSVIRYPDYRSGVLNCGINRVLVRRIIREVNKLMKSRAELLKLLTNFRKDLSYQERSSGSLLLKTGIKNDEIAAKIKVLNELSQDDYEDENMPLE